MFQSVKSRFILSSILILIITIGISAWISITTQRQQIIKLNKERLAILSESLQNEIINIMLQNHGVNLQSVLDAMGRHKEVKEIRIINPEGVITKSIHREQIGRKHYQSDLELFKASDGPQIFEKTDEDGKNVITLISTIKSQSECVKCHGQKDIIANLDLHLSLEEVYNKTKFLSKLLFISSIFSIAILSIALWGLSSRLISRPIKNLINTMTKAEGGNLSVRVDIKRNDEIGKLGNNFNSMLERLDKARVELEAFHIQQMQRAEKLASIGELASGIAHEIRNPLAGISGAIQVIASDFKDDDSRKSVIEEILKQIERLDKTIRDLLSYAKPSQPEYTINNVNLLIEKILFLIRQQTRTQDIFIKTQLDPNLPETLLDSEQIQQVLLNICINSIQAMPNGGKLIISTDIAHEDGKDYIVTNIEDTGLGITDDVKNNIFRPFFTTKHIGTGLGLPIAQRIVEQHNGFIRFESEVGKGTRFIILLPIKDSHV